MDTVTVWKTLRLRFFTYHWTDVPSLAMTLPTNCDAPKDSARKVGAPLSISLSGGGTRAALFSLGALLAVFGYQSTTQQPITLSTVSGSSLAAIEVAASEEETDAEAIKSVMLRVARYGYWPRKRNFLYLDGVISMLAIAGIFWNIKNSSMSPRTVALFFVEILLIVALVAVLVLSLMRGQPLFLRRQKLPQYSPWRKVSDRHLFELAVESYPKSRSNRVFTVKILRINVTNIYQRKRITFGLDDFMLHNTPPFIYAAASAALPGAFISQTLPGYENQLFADGGVSDNTGLDYFREAGIERGLYLAVDSRPPSQDAQGAQSRTTRPIYGKNSIKTAIADALLSVVFVWLILGLAWDKYGSLANFCTGAITVSLPLAVVAGFMSRSGFSGLRLIGGLIAEARWLASTWGTTLNTATDLRLAEFAQLCHQSGAMLSVVDMQSCEECAYIAENNGMPTTLGRLNPSTARHLTGHAYRRTCETLGVTPQEDHLAFMARL